jgi:hypothetical protein
VLFNNFKGLYIEANAISPQRTKHIGQALVDGGIDFVDGGIIGGPAWQAGQTCLYLSGPSAEVAAAYFSAGPLETAVIGEEIGKASALKMCYAAYTKGRTALLCSIQALAEKLGVRAELEREWSDFQPDLAVEAAERTRRVTAKAWRFAAEMEEISATFVAAGLPGGFHQSASEIYSRIAHYKDAPDLPTLEEVLSALLESMDSDPSN